MEKKAKKYLLMAIGSWILMFVWIFVTVWLTGEREISEFTPADRQVMGAFIAVEIAAAVFSAVCVVRWLKLPKSGALPDRETPGQTFWLRSPLFCASARRSQGSSSEKARRRKRKVP